MPIVEDVYKDLDLWFQGTAGVLWAASLLFSSPVPHFGRQL